MDKAMKWGMRNRKQFIRTVQITDGLIPPSVILCSECNNYMRCIRGHRIQKCHALRDKRACYRKYGTINFYYADVCCMTLDCINYRVTDHNMYGKSTEVSVYIKRCLAKINKHFPYIAFTKEDINEIVKMFKEHVPKVKGDELWVTII